MAQYVNPLLPCFCLRKQILTYPTALGNQLPNTYLWEEKLRDGLENDLDHRYLGNIYTSWNPWAQGFTRYGYGEPRDWREDRKHNTNYGRYRTRAIRGGGNGSHAQKAAPRQNSGVQASGQEYDNYDYPTFPTTAESLRKNGTLSFRSGSESLSSVTHGGIEDEKKE